MSVRRILMAAAAPVVAIVFSVAISSVVLLIAGTSPLEAWMEMLSYGTRLETLVATANRATPLYLAGIAVAVVKYSRGGFSKEWEKTAVYKLLFNQYYIPKIYNDFICKPYAELSRIFWKDLDLKIVDATVDFIATTIYKSGMVSRVVQSGNLSNMLRWMGVGLLILLLAAIFYSPVR
jgi:NADH-quinone oxidoreductase subunit L